MSQEEGMRKHSRCAYRTAGHRHHRPYHNKYVRQAYRTNAKIFQTNRRQVTLAATSIY